MDYQYILVDVKDRIATVTINRPEYSNAFARESYFEIADAMNTLGAREDVGAIVITAQENTSQQAAISNALKC